MKNTPPPITLRNANVQMGTIIHVPETRGAIEAIARAIEANAKAAEALARSVSPPPMHNAIGIKIGEAKT